MKVRVKWFITGNITEIEEPDAILGPQSTILELKGLIQIRFGYPAKDILLIYEKLLENDVRLRDLGICSSEDSKTKLLTCHVVRSDGSLEGANNVEDDENDSDIQEFTHEDMALAMRMLGKSVPVPTERMNEIRGAVPRQRPTFLNAPTAAAQPRDSSSAKVSRPLTVAEEANVGGGPVSPSIARNDPHYTMKNTKIHEIFGNMMYGMRSEEAEDTYSITFPNVVTPYQYWDMRLPENETYQEKYCEHEYEVCFELFFFGDWEPVSTEEGGNRFNALVRQLLETKAGIKVRTPVRPREAGCMYPLIAVAVVMTETEGMELGEKVFEDFGKPNPAGMPPMHDGTGPAAPTGGCGVQ